ncbi:MAG: hypothetical protein KatS3mg090_0347 [Patescibacteria group bacterium]|nr:MAG: hypothetical protein KatS3mg090_0347 [Patescibacteria group bacterium]
METSTYELLPNTPEYLRIISSLVAILIYISANKKQFKEILLDIKDKNITPDIVTFVLWCIGFALAGYNIDAVLALLNTAVEQSNDLILN